MLRICISGLTDSGKTSTGEALSKDLKIMHITKYGMVAYKDFKKSESARDEASKMLQTANREYAKDFDDEVRRLAKENSCVVSTWLAPWVVDGPTIRVWLHAPFEERVRRCSIERKMDRKEATVYVRKKDELNTKAFMDLYKIDVKDRSDFDMEINTGKIDVNGCVSLISMLAMSKEKMVFR